MMHYATAEFKKFVTSRQIYFGVRIALAIVIPSLVLAHFGMLKDYFLFPYGTSFVGFTDAPGPFVRRRNALLLAVVSFFFTAVCTVVFQHFEIGIFSELVVFGMLFSLIGVFGQRLASVGSLSLIILAIFIDGHLLAGGIIKHLLIFAAGCSWYFIVFMVVTKLQPYNLAAQMIGAGYLDLADFLRIKARFYLDNPDYEDLISKVISQQITIKNQQEDTREVVFKTRKIVTEATTQSRTLMLMFLNSIDLHELLMTSESDYRKIQAAFGSTGFLLKIHDFLLKLAEEITHTGLALQRRTTAQALYDLRTDLAGLYKDYFELRNAEIRPDNLEDFMILRQILRIITEITEEILSNYTVFSQDPKLAKSLSTGLDYNKFLPGEEGFNLRLLRANISLKSDHFRHAIRLTAALLLGYCISKLKFLGIGHSYWILITIIAILKPAYAITKDRNLLRICGTFCGGITAYALLYYIQDSRILFGVFLASMVLCFSLLKERYFWAVFFMTIYVFVSFNFLSPGKTDLIFRDRLLDTAIGGAVAFLVSIFVFPAWEGAKNQDLMAAAAKDSLGYFLEVMGLFGAKPGIDEDYKVARRNAIISLANLSDNFQRMLSEPKNRQDRAELVHQFVTTCHLFTAYTASLSKILQSGRRFSEIDAEGWKRKILSELQRTQALLNHAPIDSSLREESKHTPEDTVEALLQRRKQEIEEHEAGRLQDPTKITRLTDLKNIREALELMYDVAKEQRKVAENYATPQL